MNYQQFNKYIKRNLKSFNKKLIIGTTYKGRKIYAYHFGKFESAQVVLSGGMHAREYITSLLLANIIKKSSFNDLRYGIWCIPICNPDGIKICLDKVKNKKLKNIAQNRSNFKLWKANSRGVDINVNFDSLWSRGKNNSFLVGLENYVGRYPESEKETKSLVNFFKWLKPALSLSFHSKGEVVYYGYMLPKLKSKMDKTLAKSLSKIIKYKCKKTRNSHGGLSDYLSEKLGIISSTIEVGSKKINHPITINYLDDLLINFNGFLQKLSNSKNLQQYYQVVYSQKEAYQFQE